MFNLRLYIMGNIQRENEEAEEAGAESPALGQTPPLNASAVVNRVHDEAGRGATSLTPALKAPGFKKFQPERIFRIAFNLMEPGFLSLHPYNEVQDYPDFQFNASVLGKGGAG